jgi:hypothetical protein
MRLCPKTLLIAAILLAVSASIAQEPYHGADPELVARLSYHAGVVPWGNVRHVCVAVSRDGDYRIVRDDGQMIRRLHGKMPKEEFRRLTTLLGATDFRNLAGDHSGLIRQDAESFAAEILSDYRWHADGTRKWFARDDWQTRWVNADGESPFPASVSKLVDWLQSFQPKDGKSFEYAEYPDVCPVGGFRLLQPSVADN